MDEERTGAPAGLSGLSTIDRDRKANPEVGLTGPRPDPPPGPFPNWEFLTSPAEWTAPELRQEWGFLSSERRHLRQIYQTPAWFDHVVTTGAGQRVAVAVARDPEGRIRGLAPIRVAKEDLEFRLGGRVLGRASTRNALILGGLATVPEDRRALDALFASLAGALPDCDAIRLSCVAVGSYLWEYLRSARAIREEYLLHVVRSVGPYHVLRLPPTFEEYLARYSAKKRYNLKRQVRLLREQGRGRLDLHRIESSDRVPFLLEAEAWMRPIPSRTAVPGGGLAGGTWRPEEVLDLAERRLLRGYVLMCGDDPVGVINGVQYTGTYSVMDTVYRDDRAALSPGTTTLFLAIEDLLKHRPVETIDFGFGQPRQRLHPSNVTLDMVSVLLMKKTLPNRIRRGCHAAFWSALGLVKGLRARA